MLSVGSSLRETISNSGVKFVALSFLEFFIKVSEEKPLPGSKPLPLLYVKPLLFVVINIYFSIFVECMCKFVSVTSYESEILEMN